MKISILFILILAISDCQQKASENKNQPVNPAQTASATPFPTPKNGNYNGKGVVTKIDLKIVSVELDHEEIKDLMPPMRMEFYVTNKAELEVLKVGDKVDFVVEYMDGQEKIISIKKAE